MEICFFPASIRENDESYCQLKIKILLEIYIILARGKIKAL